MLRPQHVLVIIRYFQQIEHVVLGVILNDSKKALCWHALALLCDNTDLCLPVNQTDSSQRLPLLQVSRAVHTTMGKGLRRQIDSQFYMPLINH